jgi:hypothetical protein
MCFPVIEKNLNRREDANEFKESRQRNCAFKQNPKKINILPILSGCMTMDRRKIWVGIASHELVWFDKQAETSGPD